MEKARAASGSVRKQSKNRNFGCRHSKCGSFILLERNITLDLYGGTYFRPIVKCSGILYSKNDTAVRNRCADGIAPQALAIGQERQGMESHPPNYPHNRSPSNPASRSSRWSRTPWDLVEDVECAGARAVAAACGSDKAVYQYAALVGIDMLLADGNHDKFSAACRGLRS